MTEKSREETRETSKITSTLFDFKKPLPESSSSVSIVKIKSTNRGQFVYTKKSGNLNNFREHQDRTCGSQQLAIPVFP